MKIYVEEKFRIEDGEDMGDYIVRLYDTPYGFPKTFYNKTCTRKQCSSGKQRSIKDVFNVILTQRSEFKFKYFCKELRDIIYQSKTKDHIAIIFCPDVKRWVIHYWAITHQNYDKFMFGKLVFNYSKLVKTNYWKKYSGAYSLLDVLKHMEFTEEQINKELEI